MKLRFKLNKSISRQFIFIVLFLFSLSSEAMNIKFNKQSKFCENTFDFEKIEGDSTYRKMLSAYFYNSLIDSCSYKIDTSLFIRPSFKLAIIDIICKTPVDSIGILDDDADKYDVERYDDYLCQLLYNCPNLKVKIEISDELLKENNDKGLNALWNDFNENQLHNYQFYRNNHLSDKYIIMEMVMIAFNGNRNEECKYLMKLLKKCDRKLYQLAKKIINKKENISYDEYLELVFGGV